VKRLLKKPPRKLRLLKLLLKKAPTPLLLALKPLLLVQTLLLLVPKLLLRPLALLQPLLLRLMPLLLRLPLLLQKQRSKSQPLGALTETRNGRSSFGRPPFSLPVFFSLKTVRRDRLAPLPCLRRQPVVGE